MENILEICFSFDAPVAYQSDPSVWRQLQTWRYVDLESIFGLIHMHSAVALDVVPNAGENYLEVCVAFRWISYLPTGFVCLDSVSCILDADGLEMHSGLWVFCDSLDFPK